MFDIPFSYMLHPDVLQSTLPSFLGQNSVPTPMLHSVPRTTLWRHRKKFQEYLEEQTKAAGYPPAPFAHCVTAYRPKRCVTIDRRNAVGTRSARPVEATGHRGAWFRLSHQRRNGEGSLNGVCDAGQPRGCGLQRVGYRPVAGSNRSGGASPENQTLF